MAAFIADFGLMAENRAILESLKLERAVKVNRQCIHLTDVRWERLFVDDDGKEEESALCHAAGVAMKF